MKLSSFFLRSLREDPSEAETASHRLMLRAGLIRRLASGLYCYLPLGQRSLNKVINIIRDEMSRAGAAEVGLTIMQPAELWQESGRWQVYGPEMMRLEDRHGRSFCLGPTHEEVITTIAGNETKSYREMPFNLFQIQTKFRDERRPRFGVMRSREFLMKDAYSFHSSEDCLDQEYQNMKETYTKIFSRCGLSFSAVEADSGAIGGTGSEEFMVFAETGENAVVHCEACGYAANLEQAPVHAPEEVACALEETEDIATPNCKTIEAVSAFLNEPASAMMKNVLFIDDAGLFHLVSVRADYEVNDAKLARVAEGTGLRPATEEEITKELSLPVGYISPQGLPEGIKAKIRCYADHSILDGRNYITGSNANEIHRRGVRPGTHFPLGKVGDFRLMKEGDPCPKCEARPTFVRGIEVGHIFKLGTKYSQAMGAEFQDEQGKVHPIIMGCYGIGVGRTLASAIEQSHDEKGIVFPAAIAPFEVAVLPLMDKGPAWDAALALYKKLLELGVDTCLDDRKERPGVKFADAELIGFPLRVVLGKGFEKNGEVEVVVRKTGEKKVLTGEEIAQEIAELLKN